MAHHIRLDPQKVNELGVANQDSTTLPEFSFHHGHVEQAINNIDDLLSAGISYSKIPSDVSQLILVKPTFEGTLQSGYLKNSLVCQPLLRGFSDSIARGDSVIYTKIGNTYYYLGPLNTTNNPNYTPDTFFNPNLNTNLKSKIAIDNRKDDVKTYFGDLRRQSQTQFNLDSASRLDKFLVESYNLDKKEEADVLKAKGMTNFETLYENERAVELSASEFRRQGQEANLKFRADEIERNKARFDQLSSLEDQLYQIETELES